MASGEIEGQSYHVRRWLRIDRPDGTFHILFRYDLDGKGQGETTVTGSWGLESGTYWTVSQSFNVNGGPAQSCSTRREYTVLSLDASEMQYRSKETGTTYRTRRVPEDYRLP